MSARTPYVPVQAKPADITSMVSWVGSELERIRNAFARISNAMVATSAAETVATGELSIGSTTSALVGAAGGAAALPATPAGYIWINVGGTAYRVPYYN